MHPAGRRRFDADKPGGRIPCMIDASVAEAMIV
jgi:hypothetical protein